MRIPILSWLIDLIQAPAYQQGRTDGFISGLNAAQEHVVLKGGGADGRTTRLACGINKLIFPVLPPLAATEFFRMSMEDRYRAKPRFEQEVYVRTDAKQDVVVEVPVFELKPAE